MPSEQDLRDMFAASDTPRNSIDPQRVIAASRGRRRPMQIAAGAAGALVMVGIVTVTVQTSGFPTPAAVTSQGAGDTRSTADQAPFAEGFESAVKRAPADRVNLCAGTLADVAPSFYGLQLDVSFPSQTPVGTGPVSGTVRLTNTSATPVLGSTSPTPAITLSRDGVVLWHSNGPTITSLAVVDLQPGASREYQASFTPVRCDVEDDLEASFREGLPAVPAGEYDLTAAIDFSADPTIQQMDTPELDLVTGPSSQITIG
jgi:hypothetical protein